MSLARTKQLLKPPRLSAIGLLSAGGSLCCIATPLGWLGEWWWFFDLFAHFRVQYFVALALLSILMALLKSKAFAIVFAIFALINLGPLAPYYLSSPPTPPAGATVFRVLVLNVNTEAGQVAKVKEVVAAYDPDLMVLEELSASWVENLEPALADYPHRLLNPRPDNFGITLYSRLKVQSATAYPIGPADIPSIVATVEMPTVSGGTREVTLLATHTFPPGREWSSLRNAQLRDLGRAAAASPHPVLLLGDLNITPWSPHFAKMLETSGLRDSMVGFGIQPTWPTHRPWFLIPIDHCLATEEFAPLKREIGPWVGSDHLPVIVDFMLEEGGS
jgi:endonuclease/exonuclease/phosphatase (EEP) superfamily protein YafD